MALEQYLGLPGVLSLPEGWKVVPADELCSKITKGTTPPKIDLDENSSIPFLRVNNLTFEGRLNDLRDAIYVSEKSHRSFLARSIAYPNDVLMNIVGPPLGKTALLTNAFPEYNLNQAIVIYRPRPKELDPPFLLFYLNTVVAQQWLESRSKKTSGQQNLTIEICKQLPIILPPISEQRSIGQLLRIWDREIETIEKQVHNRESQLLGLMQALLTGQRRFPACSPWIETSIGSIIQEVRRETECNDDTEYRLLSIRRRSGGVFLREVMHGRHILTKNIREVYHGDFVISKMQVVHGAMGLVRKQFHRHHISGSYIAVVPKSPQALDIDFFDWFCRQKAIYHKAFLSSYGVHIEKMTFNFHQFLREKIRIPSDIAEQKKIAKVLATADSEIQKLKELRNLFRQEKTALMQQLLTGRVRLTTREIA